MIASGSFTKEKMRKKRMIKERLFWTWDHSTNWCVNTPGAQNCGVGNEYMKNPEMFVLDYKRAIDFCAAHKMTAIGIVGLLRDRHGGVESAREICAYARNKGIKVYIIAGLFAYGGIYYEGDHKYSLDKFFEKNPEAIAQKDDGSPVIKAFIGRGGCKKQYQGCASNAALHDFVLESLDWLFREIPELGGIQMESSDTGVCSCPACKRRRGADSLEEPISLADMAAIYPDAARTVRAASPDALVICETYHHFLDEACSLFGKKNSSGDLARLLEMPKDIYWQWKCDKMIRTGAWPLGAPMIENLQGFRHVMRSHTGTQWWGGRHTLGIELIRRQCLLSYESGFDAVSMFGETSPFHTNAEFNYLALEYFADHPHASVMNFAEDVMAPRLGGFANAKKWGEYASLYREAEKIPAAVMDVAKIAAECRDLETVRRWQYLGNFLNSYLYEIEAGGKLENMCPHDADRPDLF